MFLTRYSDFFPSESYLKDLKWGSVFLGASLHVHEVTRNQMCEHRTVLHVIKYSSITLGLNEMRPYFPYSYRCSIIKISPVLRSPLLCTGAYAHIKWGFQPACWCFGPIYQAFWIPFLHIIYFNFYWKGPTLSKLFHHIYFNRGLWGIVTSFIIFILTGDFEAW